MITLNRDDPPCEVTGTPDVPLKIRRRIRARSDQERLTKWGRDVQALNRTHRDVPPCSLPAAPASRAAGAYPLLLRGSFLVTLNLDWSKQLGRLPAKGEVEDLDLTIFALLYRTLRYQKKFKGGYVSFPFASLRRILGSADRASRAMTILRACRVFIPDEKWRCRSMMGGQLRKDARTSKAMGYKFAAWAEDCGVTVRPLQTIYADRLRKEWGTKRKHVETNEANRAIYRTLRKTALDPTVLDEVMAPNGGPMQFKDVYALLAVADIARRDWFFSSDEKTGRVFHNIANLPSRLRKHVLIDGRRTVEIDIASSQIVLAIARAYGPEPSVEKDRLLQLAFSRQFYPAACEWAGLTGLSYDEQKEAVFSGLIFAQEWPDKAMVAGFWKHAYKLAKYAEELRAADAPLRRQKIKANSLANGLQTLEADIMIKAVTRELRAAGIESLSIHDGVIVPVPHHAQTERIIEEEFQRLTGIKPQLHSTDNRMKQSIVSEHDTHAIGLVNFSETQTVSAPKPVEATATLMDPAFDQVVVTPGPCILGAPVATSGPAEPVRVPCPSDLCPGCWVANRAILLHSAFGCEHQAPSPAYAVG